MLREHCDLCGREIETNENKPNKDITTKYGEKLVFKKMEQRKTIVYELCSKKSSYEDKLEIEMPLVMCNTCHQTLSKTINTLAVVGRIIK